MPFPLKLTGGVSPHTYHSDDCDLSYFFVSFFSATFALFTSIPFLWIPFLQYLVLFVAIFHFVFSFRFGSFSFPFATAFSRAFLVLLFLFHIYSFCLNPFPSIACTFRHDLFFRFFTSSSLPFWFRSFVSARSFLFGYGFNLLSSSFFLLDLLFPLVHSFIS